LPPEEYPSEVGNVTSMKAYVLFQLSRFGAAARKLTIPSNEAPRKRLSGKLAGV
jgi:hypothetical protein